MYLETAGVFGHTYSQLKCKSKQTTLLRPPQNRCTEICLKGKGLVAVAPPKKILRGEPLDTYIFVTPPPHQI